jgi:predicted dehydrogenase
MIQINKSTLTSAEPLQAELRAFLEAVQTRTKPVVSLEDGRRALAVALEILEAIQSHGERIQKEFLAPRKH